MRANLIKRLNKLEEEERKRQRNNLSSDPNNSDRLESECAQRSAAQRETIDTAYSLTEEYRAEKKRTKAIKGSIYRRAREIGVSWDTIVCNAEEMDAEERLGERS